MRLILWKPLSDIISYLTTLLKRAGAFLFYNGKTSENFPIENPEPGKTTELIDSTLNYPFE